MSDAIDQRGDGDGPRGVGRQRSQRRAVPGETPCLRARNGFGARVIARSLLLTAALHLPGAALGAPDGAPQVSESAQRVAEILEQVRARYARPIDDRKLIADAVNGVLNNLDPHSTYLDADAFRLLQMDGPESTAASGSRSPCATAR